jgi:hypothetical protein
LRREREHFLWGISQDGKRITGLAGLFTNPGKAREHIDRYLEDLEDQEEKEENATTENETTDGKAPVW